MTIMGSSFDMDIVSWCVGVFGGGLSIVVLISRVFRRKFWKKPAWIIGAVLFGITHIILTIMMATYIAVHLGREAMSGMAWGWFLIGDFPISLLIWPMFGLFDLMFSNVMSSRIFFYLNSVIIPFLLFATLGTLQYCLWGALLGKVLEKVRMVLHRS